MAKKLIIDVDTGVDDAMAIMVALANPDVEILGITCCHGNTPLENVLKNTLRVLKICNRLDIPVYRGCSKPLLARKQHAGDYHGKDGLGDVPDPDALGLDLLLDEDAYVIIYQHNSVFCLQVILVATAPLTNLAVTVQLDPSLPKKLKALYIMGGNTECRLLFTLLYLLSDLCVYVSILIITRTVKCLCAARGNTCPIYISTWEFTCRNSLSWCVPVPPNIQQLCTSIEEEWTYVPQHTINNLINSMPIAHHLPHKVQHISIRCVAPCEHCAV
uniref:Inosine/uridine-preferring nucleoside hydrolase domain-containing protein n=1 Tax=Maylandia zebra TaxID=106582 RepID=A0A3P9CMT1_9CICH